MNNLSAKIVQIIKIDNFSYNFLTTKGIIPK